MRRRIIRRRTEYKGDNGNGHGHGPVWSNPDADFDWWGIVLDFCNDVERSKRDYALTETNRASDASLYINHVKMERLQNIRARAFMFHANQRHHVMRKKR